MKNQEIDNEKVKYEAYTYILECSDKTFYTGYTVNIENRINAHNNKTASKYTRVRTPVKLVYSKGFYTKNEAMSYENYIKQLSREDKKRLIKGIIDHEYVIKKRRR